MKCETVIDKSCEEKVIIYAKEKSKLIKAIEQFVEENSIGLTGYKNKEIISLSSSDIYCITVTDNKVYAICEKEKFLLKSRLYMIEGELPESFVKINQSCIANINKIEKFDTSITGTLKIRFKNGYTDYVSRRQLKNVKERICV